MEGWQWQSADWQSHISGTSGCTGIYYQEAEGESGREGGTRKKGNQKDNRLFREYQNMNPVQLHRRKLLKHTMLLLPISLPNLAYSVCGPHRVSVGYLKEVALIKGNSAANG